MVSLAPDQTCRPNLTRFAAAGLLAFAAMLSACKEGSAGPNELALDKLVCQPGDLPETYRHQAAGNFSLGNLADLAPNPTARRAQLRAAGVKGGYFSTWREAVGDPPFPAAIDIVCQVIRFDTAEEATAFVAAMKPTPGDLATAAISWLPDDDQTAEELPAPAHMRAFRVSADDPAQRVTIFAVVATNGPYLQTVYAGNAGDRASLDIASTAETALLKRTGQNN
jgi:hypothetical protein